MPTTAKSGIPAGFEEVPSGGDSGIPEGFEEEKAGEAAPEGTRESLMASKASPEMQRGMALGEMKRRFARHEVTPEGLKGMGAVGLALGTPMAAGEMAGTLAEALGWDGIGASFTRAVGVGVGQAGADVALGERNPMKLAKSAAWSAAVSLPGETLASQMGKATAAGEEAGMVPRGARTRKAVKQIMGNREMLKQMGATDQEIEDFIKLPTAEAQYEKLAAQADATSAMFTKIVRNGEDELHGRFGEIFRKYPNAKISSDKMADAIDTTMRQGYQLRTKAALPQKIEAAQLATMSPAERYMYGLSQRLGSKGRVSIDAPALLQDLRESGTSEKVLAALPNGSEKELTAEQIGALRTMARRNLPFNRDNFTRMGASQLNELFDAAQDTALRNGGANEQDIAALKGAYKDWGRFQDMKDTIDPRDPGKLGTSVARALFDPMVQKTDTAVAFIKYAKSAEKAFPGEIMPQLRRDFVQNMMEQAYRPGEPIGTAVKLRGLRNDWSQGQNLRVVLKEMFGEDSPMVNPMTFSQTLGVMADSSSVVAAAGKAGRNMLSSPYMQGAVIYGGIALASGQTPKSYFMALMGRNGGAAQMSALAAALFGPAIMNFALASGNSPLQRAMVSAMTNPTASNITHYAATLGAVMTDPYGHPLAVEPETPTPPAAPPGGAPSPSMPSSPAGASTGTGLAR